MHLPLVRRAASMPEEEPLQTLVPLQLVLEPELVLLVRELQQIQQLGRRLHHGEGRVLGVVDEDGDAAVGVQAQEPLLLLLVGRDVDERRGPFGAVGELEFFEKDLDFLPVRSRLRDEVEALGTAALVYHRTGNVSFESGWSWKKSGRLVGGEERVVVYLCMLDLIWGLGDVELVRHGRGPGVYVRLLIGGWDGSGRCARKCGRRRSTGGILAWNI